jgi:hypothetical protein
MDWGEERQIILNHIGEDDWLSLDAAADAIRLLTACQQALKERHGILDLLDTIPVHDENFLEIVEGGIVAAPLPNPKRKAALYGASKLARAYLWSTKPDTDDD